jgi:hypothetical protein
MGGASRSSSTTTTEKNPFSGPGGLRREFMRAFDIAAHDQRAHVDLFQRLHKPHDGHVRAWEQWKARPWTWRNYLAAALNWFYRWLESDNRKEGKW